MDKIETMSLGQLTALRMEKTAAVNQKLDELPADEVPTDAQMSAVADLNKEIETIERAIAAQNGKAQDWAAERAKAKERAAAWQTPAADGYTPPSGGDPKTKATANRPQQLSEVILGDPAFKAWLDSMTVGGRLRDGRFGMSPPVTIEGREFKDLVTGTADASGGALITPDYKPLVALPYIPLVMRDILTMMPTQSDLVSFPREVSRTNAAAEVGEATSDSGATGSKPQSSFVLERAESAVKTIAHWIAITRQALADAGQLKVYINTFLTTGLNLRWETQVLVGDGAGDNLRGILNTTGITTQAWSTSILETTRKARTASIITGLANPTAYILNPYDWETIDLTADNEKRYYYGGPAVLGNPRLWGLPVVEARGLTQGTGLTGDFATVVWFDRMAVQLYMSDSHMDFFTRNLVAILAEMRGALALLRPAAIVSIDLTA